LVHRQRVQQVNLTIVTRRLDRILGHFASLLCRRMYKAAWPDQRPGMESAEKRASARLMPKVD
jgi:hypothetical protein